MVVVVRDEALRAQAQGVAPVGLDETPEGRVPALRVCPEPGCGLGVEFEEFRDSRVKVRCPRHGRNAFWRVVDGEMQLLAICTVGEGVVDGPLLRFFAELVPEKPMRAERSRRRLVCKRGLHVMRPANLRITMRANGSEKRVCLKCAREADAARKKATWPARREHYNAWRRERQAAKVLPDKRARRSGRDNTAALVAYNVGRRLKRERAEDLLDVAAPAAPLPRPDALRARAG